MKAQETEIKGKYDHLKDEDIIAFAKKGDHIAFNYMLEKYKFLVKYVAKPYFLIGADHEDIIQEGMIGLFKAVNDFVPEKNDSFRFFAETCISRQIINAVRAANRSKHKPLNEAISLDHAGKNEEDTGEALIDLLDPGTISDPADIMIAEEEDSSVERKVRQKLTDFERQVLNLFLQGYNYSEIAQATGKQYKAIDNALQRVRKKLPAIFGY